MPAAKDPAAGGVTRRRLRYGFTIRNRSGAVVPLSQLTVRTPLARTPWQRCVRATSRPAGKAVTDDRGGSLLRISFTNLPPFASRHVWVDVDLLMRDVPDLAERECADGNVRWMPPVSTNPIGVFDYRDDAFDRPARRLGGMGADETAGRIHKWVGSRVHRRIAGGSNRGALRAMRERVGDCSELMALFVALARKRGVAACGVGGVACDGDAVLRPADYHNWSVFRGESGWRIADPDQGVLRKGGSRFVAFEWIDGRLLPDDYVRRYRVTGEGVRAEMR
jgi:hypothetical protein